MQGPVLTLASLRAWLLGRGRPGRGDAVVLATLAIAVFTRWVDRSLTIQSWDGATFALATERYDMNALRPHAPGYPLFVLAAKGMRLLVPEANAAFVLLSLVFTALALGLAYGLGTAVLNRLGGLALASLLLVDPVVYAHSVTANVYTADLACSVAVAWAAWRCREQTTRRRLLVLASAFALAVGIRPSQGLFLAPVVAWGALRPPWNLAVQVRRLAPPVALGAGLGLAWFLPMAHVSGGLSTWRTANRLQSDQIVFADTVFTHGWPIVRANLERLDTFLHWQQEAFALPLLLLVGAALLVAARPRRTQPYALPSTWTRGVAGFLSAWALPTLAFYALVFDGWGNGPSGYVLVFLPAALLVLLLVAQAALVALRTAWNAKAVAVVAVAALAAAGAGLAQHGHDIPDVNYRQHDGWAEAWSHLPESFPPSNTTIVTLWNFAHVWYHFPEYTTYNYRAPRNGPGEAPDFLMIQVAKDREATPDWYSAVAAGPQPGHYALPNGTENLILFDFQLAGENGGESQLRDGVAYHEAWLPNGWRVLYVKVEPGKGNLEDYFSMDGLQ